MYGRHQLLGAWVAIQQVDAAMIGQSKILRPWTARAPDAFIGLVLAIGQGIANPPFEVGDFVVVETMSGHPHMAGIAPDRPKPGGGTISGGTRAVDLRCDTWGGDPSKIVGLVRYLPEPLRVSHVDDEAARRHIRGAHITDVVKNRKEHLDDVAEAHLVQERNRHEVWLRDNERRRADGRRSRLMKPAFDPGAGEGVVARIGEASDLLRLGVDAAWLADTLRVSQAAPCTACGGAGWAIRNEGEGVPDIQGCDACRVYDVDEDAYDEPEAVAALQAARARVAVRIAADHLAASPARTACGLPWHLVHPRSHTLAAFVALPGDRRCRGCAA